MTNQSNSTQDTAQRAMDEIVRLEGERNNGPYVFSYVAVEKGIQSLSDRIDVLEGAVERWRPIETVPMDGRWLYLLGFDGSDFENENEPRLDCAIRWRTKWVQPRDEERFDLVAGSDLYRRSLVPQEGYWWDCPGQLEYVYAWRPDDPAPPDLRSDDPIFQTRPLDTRGDDFNKLRAALHQEGIAP